MMAKRVRTAYDRSAVRRALESIPPVDAESTQLSSSEPTSLPAAEDVLAWVNAQKKEKYMLATEVNRLKPELRKSDRANVRLAKGLAFLMKERKSVRNELEALANYEKITKTKVNRLQQLVMQSKGILEKYAETSANPEETASPKETDTANADVDNGKDEVINDLTFVNV